MSRCYPFPPPGYVRHESLIESIKGTKEEAKREKRHSKHKKDKKRKDRENNEEAKQSKKHRHHKRQKQKDETATNEVVELLEKSCLTTELEFQTSSSHNSCDSTLCSNERPPKKVQSQQTFDGMHNDSDLEAPRDDALRVSLEKSKDTIFGSPREISTQLGKEKETIPVKEGKSRGANRQQPSTKLGKERPSSRHQEAMFLNLIENWTPGRVERNLTDSEDQEQWLFMKSGAKRHYIVSDQTTTSNGSGSTAWPAARFLQEAEVYALPYTVPF